MGYRAVDTQLTLASCGGPGGDQLEGKSVLIRQKEQGERNEGALAEPGSQDRQPPPSARTPAGLIYSGPGSKDGKPGGFPLQKEAGPHAQPSPFALIAGSTEFLP